MSIILYDIPSKLPGSAWSPNTLKARIALLYKGLPFKTEWLEYPEIEPAMIRLGADPDPTRKKLDGSPCYTLPVIHDTTTGKVVADSMKIAQYLDETYQDKPLLFPYDARAPIHVFSEFLSPLLQSFVPLIVPPMCSKLSPQSEEYYRRLWKGLLGVELVDIVPPPGPKRDEAWAKVKANLSKIAVILQKNGADKGPYFYGDTFSHADVIVVGFLHWARAILGQEPEWADFESWDGGHWARLMEWTKEYQKLE